MTMTTLILLLALVNCFAALWCTYSKNWFGYWMNLSVAIFNTCVTLLRGA